MAGEKIVLAELDLDLQAAFKATTELKAEIKKLREENAELKKSGQEASAEFVRNEAAIKKLSSSYNQHSAVIKSRIDDNNKLATSEERINQVMSHEVVTIEEAKKQNSELRRLRDQVNATTAEGAATIAELNDRIDDNTQFIRENASAYEQLKMDIGSYKEQMTEALQTLNPMNGGLTGFIERANAAGGVGPLLTGTFASLKAGLVGATKAGLAFLATPIGAAIGALAVVVGLVVGAFKFMTASMNSTEEGSQKLAKVTGAVKGIFEGLWKIIKPLGEWMGAVFIATVETLGGALEFLLNKIADGMEFLGMEEAAEGLRTVTKEVKASAQASADLAAAEGKLAKMQREARKTQLDYQKQAEKLRQLRDDESKTISERMAINEQLGKVLDKQAAAELRIAQQRLEVANRRLKAEGQTTEALDAQAEALTEIADIEERIEGQRSEQLANLNSLRKEAADAEKQRHEEAMARRQKALDDAKEKIKLEADLYIASQGVKAKSLQEEMDLARKVYEDKLRIAQAEYDASEKTENDKLAHKIAVADATNELNQKSAEIAISLAEQELLAITKNNQAILNNSKFLSEQLYNDKVAALDAIAEAERSYQEERLKNGAINEQAYNDEIARINDESRKAQEQLRIERETAEREKKLTDLENQKIIDEENFIAQMELERQRLELQREQELAEAEKTGADMQLIKNKYAQLDKSITKSVEDFKMQQRMAVISGLKGLFSEESRLGKLLASAEIINTTAQNAAKAFTQAAVFASNPLTAPLALNAKIQGGIIIATGAAQLAKTAGVKFEKGGLQEIGGNRHSAGGTKFWGEDGTAFEAEQGELIGVMNRNAARHFMAFNNQYASGAGSASNYFASGGIVSREISPDVIDTDTLAIKLAQAYSSLPSPVVDVTDIITEGSRTVNVKEGANF